MEQTVSKSETTFDNQPSSASLTENVVTNNHGGPILKVAQEYDKGQNHDTGQMESSKNYGDHNRNITHSIMQNVPTAGVSSKYDNDELSALASARLGKLRKRINADAWSNELEDLMQSWGEKAAGNRELHRKASGYWRKFSDRLYLPVILLSTIGGVSNFGAANTEDPVYWMYAIGTINIVAATLASIVKYYKPDERSQEHASVAKNFGSFYRNMTVELGLSREDRMNSDELTRWAKAEYDRIQKEAPSVPGKILNEYMTIYKDNRNNPDIVSTHFEIKINGRVD